jgi:hypothetical protein
MYVTEHEVLTCGACFSLLILNSKLSAYYVHQYNCNVSGIPGVCSVTSRILLMCCDHIHDSVMNSFS